MLTIYLLSICLLAHCVNHVFALREHLLLFLIVITKGQRPLALSLRLKITSFREK